MPRSLPLLIFLLVFLLVRHLISLILMLASSFDLLTHNEFLGHLLALPNLNLAQNLRPFGLTPYMPAYIEFLNGFFISGHC